MGYSLVGSGDYAAFSPTASNFMQILGGCFYVSNQQTTEANVATPMPVSGTLFGLTAATGPVTGTFTGQLRRNGANANQSFTDVALTSPASDPCAFGDLIALAWPAATGSLMRAQMILTASPHAAIWATTPFGAYGPISANNTVCLNLAVLLTSTYPASLLVQQQLGVAGLLQGLNVVFMANATLSAQPFTLYLNGAATAQVATVAAGLTGAFQDTTHQTAVNVGDVVYAQYYSGGGAVTISATGIGFVNPSAPSSDLWASVNFAINASNTAYIPIYGKFAYYAVITEAQAQIAHGFAVTMSGMKLSINSNAATVSSPLTLRKNGAFGNQNLTVAAGLTGWFVDTTNTDVCSATDKVCYRWVSPAAGAVGLVFIGVVEWAPFAVSVSEVGAAADTSASMARIGVSALESGSATDAAVSSNVTLPTIRETGSALDTLSAAIVRENDIAEQGAAQDVTDRFDLIRLTVVEQGQARDAEIVMGSLAYAEVLGMTARVVHRHAVTGGILDDEAIPLLDDQGVWMFEDT